MKPARVVLIEDHTLVRHLLGAVFKRDAALVLAGDFSTAAAGIKGCLKLKPDVVIIDWLLPDGKGMDVVRAVTQKLPSTRFLFLTSLEKEHIVRESIDAGVHGFVVKRASYEILREAIHTVFNGKSYYCPVSSRLLIEALRTVAVKGPNGLSPRERDILRGLARSASIKDFSELFKSSPKTVSNQLSTLKDKLAIYDTVGLVRYALHHGLVEAF